MTIRIGFDIGGVLSKHPAFFRPLIEALNAHPDFEVHVLTDVQPPRSIALIHENGYPVPAERIHSADYATHREACKAVMAKELRLDVLVDDHLPYLDPIQRVCGDATIRLHVMPGSNPDLFHPDIKQCR